MGILSRCVHENQIGWIDPGVFVFWSGSMPRRGSAGRDLEIERIKIEDLARHVEEHASGLLEHVWPGKSKVGRGRREWETNTLRVVDGKDYPVTGDPNSDTRSYTKLNDRTLTTINKKNGKIRVTGQIVISPDGKSRTITVTGTTPAGKKFKNVAIYDKQ